MKNITLTPSTQSPVTSYAASGKLILRMYLDFADSQEKSATLWFLLSLMINGVLFLIVPPVLIWNFGAPLAVLGVTVVGFFSNLIANMGGSGIRTTITLFFLMVLINTGMLIFYIV